MPLVVGVSFRKVGKVYYFDPGDLHLCEGDNVIAETARGVEFGEIVIDPREVPESELVAPLKKIVRVATSADLEKESSNREKERHAYSVCEQKIAEHNLPMKLLEAEYAFDCSQVTFSFSADGRVDFRELVKDVAGVLKTKVQLHQIGVRDEAKLIGGYGTCGRSLCCATFLSSFDPISMKMAKDQSLFLNPAKFSGACGKLMCCLRYEHDFYKYAQKTLPSVGAVLEYENGRVKVMDVNVISNTITVQTEEEVLLHIPASELNLNGLCRKHGVACNMNEQNCQPLLPLGACCESAVDSVPDDDEADEIIDEEVPEAEDDLPVVEESDWEEVTGVRWRDPGQSSNEPASDDSAGAKETDEPAENGQRKSRRVPRSNGRSRHPGKNRQNGGHNRGPSSNKQGRNGKPKNNGQKESESGSE